MAAGNIRRTKRLKHKHQAEHTAKQTSRVCDATATAVIDQLLDQTVLMNIDRSSLTLEMDLTPTS